MNTLSEWRNRLGLTQEQWAGILGVNKGQLAMAETGKRQLPAKSKLVFAKIQLMAQSIQGQARPGNLNESARSKKEKWIRKMEIKQQILTGQLEVLEEKSEGIGHFLDLTALSETQSLFEHGSEQKDHWELAKRKANKKMLAIQEEIFRLRVQHASIAAALETAGFLLSAHSKNQNLQS